MNMQSQSMKERFIIRMTGEGMEISSARARVLRFSACDALMLLDILRAEEDNLRKIADQASPLPMRILTKANTDEPTESNVNKKP